MPRSTLAMRIHREPIEERKRLLAKLLRRPHPGIALNEHYEGDGAIFYISNKIAALALPQLETQREAIEAEIGEPCSGTPTLKSRTRSSSWNAQPTLTTGSNGARR